MALEKSSLDALKINRDGASSAAGGPWLWVIAVVVLLLISAAVVWTFAGRSGPEVEVWIVKETAASGQTTLLNSSGYVVARREATVSSKVTGKVMEVMVEEGMRVEEGQILARLDASNVKTSLELAQAQVASARSALKETQVRLHAAELDLRRVSGLATNRVSSEADLDRATAEAHSLQARLGQQTAEIVVAERQLALWTQQMDDTLIRAPFSGIVVSKNAQPGEMISPVSAGGGFTRTGICTIVDMDSLEIEIDVNESYINRVQPGQSVEATLDAYPDWKIPCKVKAIIPTADRQKATVKVRVAFDRMDSRILPQMGVKVAFRGGVAQAERAELLVPRSAVREEDGRQVVFLLQEGQLERRAVQLGTVRGDQVAIIAGLAGGDRVIVNPSGRKEGDRVKEKRQ